MIERHNLAFVYRVCQPRWFNIEPCPRPHHRLMLHKMTLPLPSEAFSAFHRLSGLEGSLRRPLIYFAVWPRKVLNRGSTQSRDSFGIHRRILYLSHLTLIGRPWPTMHKLSRGVSWIEGIYVGAGHTAPIHVVYILEDKNNTFETQRKTQWNRFYMVNHNHVQRYLVAVPSFKLCKFIFFFSASFIVDR